MNELIASKPREIVRGTCVRIIRSAPLKICPDHTVIELDRLVFPSTNSMETRETRVVDAGDS